MADRIAYAPYTNRVAYLDNKELVTHERMGYSKLFKEGNEFLVLYLPLGMSIKHERARLNATFPDENELLNPEENEWIIPMENVLIAPQGHFPETGGRVYGWTDGKSFEVVVQDDNWEIIDSKGFDNLQDMQAELDNY